MVMKTYSSAFRGPRNRISYRGTLTGNGVVGVTTFSSVILSNASVLNFLGVGSRNNGKNRIVESPHSYDKIHFFGWRGTKYDGQVYQPNLSWDLESGQHGSSDLLVTGLWGVADTEAYNAALADLVSQIRGGVDLSIDLLQSGQTKTMVNTWYKAIKQLGKTLREVRKQPLKAMASARLQYMYGVQPTLSTMYELLNNTYGQYSKPTVVTGKGTSQKTSTQSSSSCQSYPCNNVSVLKGTTIVEMRATFKKPNSVLANMQNYTSLNPASIAYELTPFSFVLDWMWDFGGYLRNLESSFTLSPFVTNLGVSTLLIQELTAKAEGHTRSSMERRISLSGGAKRVKFTRTTPGGIPVPYMPAFGGNLGLTRGLNSIALLRQLASPIDSKLRLIR